MNIAHWATWATDWLLEIPKSRKRAAANVKLALTPRPPRRLCLCACFGYNCLPHGPPLEQLLITWGLKGRYMYTLYTIVPIDEESCNKMKQSRSCPLMCGWDSSILSFPRGIYQSLTVINISRARVLSSCLSPIRLMPQKQYVSCPSFYILTAPSSRQQLGNSNLQKAALKN